MKASFDAASTNYDETFTHSVIGKLQRKFVYNHLSQILKKHNPKSILEINCGTGEDAIWLAKQEYKVIATDISDKMIEVAKSKIQLENLEFETLDINTITKKFSDKQFDFIFSNFGGLNCLPKTELRTFFKNASQILSQNGQMALVIMPRNTIWEQFYFVLKGKFSSAFRRKKECSIANVDDEKVTTYYYNPKEIVNLAFNEFKSIKCVPIGFFIPPSYLEPFFKNKPTLISFLKSLENRISSFSVLSKYADHYLIYLQKR